MKDKTNNKIFLKTLFIKMNIIHQVQIILEE